MCEQDFRFYFENLATNKCQQTNDLVEAWEWFHSCEVPCELFEDDHMAAEKYYCDPEGMDFTLMEEIYEDEPDKEMIEV